MILLDNVTKKYPTTITKTVTAVRNLSLEVKEGEVFGFLGPNGSGKTTTLKMLLGLVKPSNGIVKLMGQDPTSYKSREKIGYLPENPYFYSHLTGKELLEFAGNLYEMPHSKINEKIDYLLNLVSLKGKENIPLRGYSKGMLQRIGLAQALINDPELVLLDEPMSGLDPIGRFEVKNIILDLKKQGKTIFFCSHILSDVEKICTDIAIILNGEKIEGGKIDEVMKGKDSLEEYFIRIIKEHDYESVNHS